MTGDDRTVSVIVSGPGRPVHNAVTERVREVRDRASHGSVLVVLDGRTGVDRVRAGLPPDADAVTTMTVAELAERSLETEGSEIPVPNVHAGRPIPESSRGTERREAWFDRWYRRQSGHDDRLSVIGGAADLVTVLEGLVRDRVLPTPDGWIDGAEGRLIGDDATIRRRLAAIGSVVSGIDESTVEEAVSADRVEAVSFAHDALTSYLEWCLDHDAVTDTQRIGYASTAPAGPSVDHVIIGGTGVGMASATLASATAGSTLSVVTGPDSPDGVEEAWRIRPEMIAGALDTEPPSDPLQSIASFDADIWERSTGDPIADALAAIERSLAGDTLGVDEPPRAPSPADICVVTTTDAQARRLMRHARTGGLSLARVGEVAICRTDVALLSLAWLRIVTGNRAKRGWAVVLERAGCSPGDLEAWLDGNDKPSDLAAVRSDLKRLGDGHAIVEAVARRYGLDSRATTALQGAIAELVSGVSSPDRTRQAIEVGVERHLTRHLEEPRGDVVTVLASATSARPSPIMIHVGDRDPGPSRSITYTPPLGLRMRRSIVRVDGTPIERPDPNWETLVVLRTPPLGRRSAILRRRLAAARDHGIVTGKDAILVDARHLPTP